MYSHSQSQLSVSRLKVPLFFSCQPIYVSTLSHPSLQHSHTRGPVSFKICREVMGGLVILWLSNTLLTVVHHSASPSTPLPDSMSELLECGVGIRSDEIPDQHKNCLLYNMFLHNRQFFYIWLSCSRSTPPPLHP